MTGIALGALLGANAAAQAKPAPPTAALKDGYVNETPASTGLREYCDGYTAEANRYLAGGDARSAAQFVAEVNNAKGCSIVYHSYSFSV